MPRALNALAYALVALAAATLPFWLTQPYYLHILILVGLWSVAALGVRALLQIGQLNFGQAGFMAIGAYASAFLVAQFGLNFWLALPISGLGAALVAALIGYPALRLRGPYFAILTMAVGLVVRQILVLPHEITGGLTGFPYPIEPPDPIRFMGLSLVFDDKAPFYYLVGGLLLAVAVVARKMDKSRLGAVSRAIRENDVLASSLGINVSKYSVLVFAISGLFAGLAGAVWTHYHQLAHPEFFGIWQSVFLVAFVVVGGRNHVVGPVLGSLFLVGGFEFLAVAEQFQTIAYGAAIILAQGGLPDGLISIPGVVARWARSPFALRSGRRARAREVEMSHGIESDTRVSPTGARR